MARLACTTALQDRMREAYREVIEAASDPGQRVAWCSSVGPVELLRALGFRVFIPENHAAMLGASRMATDLIPEATALGYSPDICSYLTSDIGAFCRGVTALSRVDPSFREVPRPDVLVHESQQCREVGDWFQWYGDRLGVPVLGVPAPRAVEEVTPDLVQALASRIEALVEPLEAIAGRSLDLARLRDVVAISRETSRRWQQVLAMGEVRPAPWTFFDACIQMGPAVVLRGDRRALAHYDLLQEELRQRVVAEVAAVPGEQVRLYWEGMPIWGRLRDLSERLASLRAAVVGSTYCSSWVFEALDPDRPFESMAQAGLELFISRTDPVKERILEEEARRYSVSGIVFHDAKTCPYNSNSRFGMPRRLTRDRGIPTVTIQSDLNDLRLHFDEGVHLALEAFVEQCREAMP